MLRRLLFMVAAVGTLEACSNDKRLDLGDYDDSCVTDSDCALVDPVACPGCPICPEAAINFAEVDRLEAEKASVLCGPPRFGSPRSCDGCAPRAARCDEGTCLVVDESADTDGFSFADYSRACNVAEDCMLVSVDPCTCPDCLATVVAASERGRYEEDVANCPGEPDDACNCVGPYTATCVDGVCGRAVEGEDTGDAGQ
jgi:hypothetical protein